MRVLTLEGSQGEGGGQILRTALSLSMITGRPFRLTNIRAGRPNPGLLPQHLSAVRAAAIVSGASVSGDRLRSAEITFSPGHAPAPGSYVVDVAEASGLGSAGSVTLILQTLAIPLAFANARSTLILRGGTHVQWSPPFDDLLNSYLPLLQTAGYRIAAELTAWGLYPIGKGEIRCEIQSRPPVGGRPWPKPIEALNRGALRRISGRAVAANLPAHIPQRMVDRTTQSLMGLGVPLDIEPQCIKAASAGAGIFLLAEYADVPASFSAYGRRGKPSEVVADEAVNAIEEHHASQAAIEIHLADQLLLPVSLAADPSEFTVARPTSHLRTNAWTIAQFEAADISIIEGAPCRVRIRPRAERTA